MLTAENIRSASEGTSYYCKGASYYSISDEKEFQYKVWYGKGAQDLGLKGEVKEKDLNKILEGKINYDGREIHLGTRNKGMIDHAPGKDFTLAAPKSVSLQHNLEGGDGRIKDALIKSAKNTFDYIEDEFLSTRIKEEGKIKLKKTGNAVGALFYENLNRNKEFHDHIHCVFANMTKRDDGKWRSTELRRVFDNKVHIGKVFRMELAFELNKLGYEIEVTDHNSFLFEIKDFDKNLNNHFSTRREQIIEKAREFNKNLNAKVRQLANIITRNPDKKISPTELKELTFHRIKEYEKTNNKEDVHHNISLRTEIAKKRSSINQGYTKDVRYAVAKSIEHLSERSTVFFAKDILDLSPAFSPGRVNKLLIKRELAKLLKKEVILKGEGKYDKIESQSYTTRHSLEREKSMINIMKSGKGTFKSITTSKIADINLKETDLNEGQKRAAKLILTSKDKISGIQGYAGTGKTYMLSKVRNIIEKISEDNINKPQIIGMAASGAATKELGKVLGQENVQTLQSLLKTYEGYAKGRGTQEGKLKVKEEFKNKIFIVDEASMISSKQLRDLLSIINVFESKVVLIGDSRQLSAVEEGNPFYELQREGMKTETMNKVVRQKTDHQRSIVYNMYAKNIGTAFKKIGNNIVDCSTLNAIENSKSQENSESQESLGSQDIALATTELFFSFSENKRENTIILAQSNLTKDYINEYIRETLITQSFLGKTNVDITTLVNQNFTIAQKGYIGSYKNNVLLFNKSNRNHNIDKNEYFWIEERSNEHIKLKSTKSLKTITLSSEELEGARENIEVYEEKDLGLRKGDKIIFTRKIDNTRIPIMNSTFATINDIGKKNIELLINDKIIDLPKDHNAFKHIDYGYCRTTHKGQGATAKTAIVVTESWWEHLTTDKNILVQTTRHQDEVYLVVDNKDEVISRIVNYTDSRTGAIEFLHDQKQNLIRSRELEESIFKFMGGQNEYSRYKISEKEAKGYSKEDHNIYKEIDKELLNKIAPKTKEIYKQIIKQGQKDHFKKIKDNIISSKKQNNLKDNIKKKYYIPQFSQSQLQEKFKEAIQETFRDNNLRNLDLAISKAFHNHGEKIRFGEKNSCEIRWYGNAGYVKDFRSGQDLRWGEGNIKLSKEERKSMKHIMLSNKDINQQKHKQEQLKKERYLEKQLNFQQVANKAKRYFDSYDIEPNRGSNNKYLTRKSIIDIYNNRNIRFTKDNRIIVPLKDANNKIRTLQFISEDGKKMYMKGGQKTGNFFTFEDEKLSKSATIYLTEGFATAASIYMATNSAVVACMDANNIEPTLRNLKEKYPNKEFIIAADNDRFTKINGKNVNYGKLKAEEASKKHDAKVILPNFNNHNNKEQKNLRLTDFNDLHGHKGIKELKNQINHHEKINVNTFQHHK